MRATPSRVSEQPYSYYCYAHNSSTCTEVILANDAFRIRNHERSQDAGVLSKTVKDLQEPSPRVESPHDKNEWKMKWAKAKRSARDTLRRTIQRGWTSFRRRDESAHEDQDEDEDQLRNSASQYGSSPHFSPETAPTPRNGEVQWQLAPVTHAPRSSMSIQRHQHQQQQHQRKSSAPLPTSPTSSFYEGANGNGIEAPPYVNQQHAYHCSRDQMSRAGRGGRMQRPGQNANIEMRPAAPLAKPEPLTDLEKPAYDTSQFTKQAAMAMPQQTRTVSCDQESVPAQFHQKTIRFADEQIGEDSGIMSESETTSTSGTNSSVRRRQMGSAPRQPGSPHSASIAGQRRSLAEDSIQQQQQAYGIIVRDASSHSARSDNKTGIVFLQYQGETKRAVLPCGGQDDTTKCALQSMTDVRMLFLKAFQPEISPEYLQSTLVKIYIQDPSKTDVFYELEDLNDVKDRAVLKLHECPTRPNSPPTVNSASAPPTQFTQSHNQHQPPASLLAPPMENFRVVSPVLENLPVVDANLVRASPRQQLRSELRNAAVGYNQAYRFHHHHQHPQSSSLSDDMNYFSEPEFDAAGDYRVRKSASTGNYCASPAYQQHVQNVDQRRHYGTIDRLCGTLGRSPYRGHQQGPPKPERHFGPGIPSGGRATMRRSQSPQRMTLTGNGRALFGHSTDPEDAYGIRGSSGNSDYAPSPTNDALMDALFNRPPSVTRSGSVTPVIDEEARIRMINMEKQLANLSSLVHSALMSKGASDTVYKDLEMLRREILGSGSGPQPTANGVARDDASDSGSVSRFSDVSSDKGSSQQSTERDSNGISEPVNGTNNTAAPILSHPETKQTLKSCKRRVGEIQSELRNLRRLAQLNAQSSRDILKDAFDRIKVILNTNKQIQIFTDQGQAAVATANPLSSDRNWVDHEQERYRKAMQKVEGELRDLEKQVELLRQKVISGERKLRMTEVESFTEALGQIGRMAAHMKTNFPMLQERLKHVMSAEMEKVVKEEKFLKDEPPRVDVVLKRCKKLTNTMVTMKKLAMVQDPAAYYGTANRSQSPKLQGNEGTAVQNGMTIANPTMEDNNNPRTPSREPESTPKMANHTTGGGPSPPRKPMSGSNTNGGHVLDSLLEELQNVAKNVSVDSHNAPIAVDNGPTEKNGTNGEKRVGFADEVQIMSLSQETSDSDTIKRAPKGTNGAVQQNGIARGQSGSTGNGGKVTNGVQNYTSAYGQQLLPGAVDSRHRSASPLLVNSIYNSTSNTANRAHSGTPCSMISDQAPPPPPRSSSRTMLTNPNDTDITSHSESPYRNFDLDGLKQQLNLGSAKPAAIVQTNAVDEEPRLVKSASSSDSVNSQDGRERRLRLQQRQRDGYMSDGMGLDQHLYQSPPVKPPPPPPPPRNKQEMLEQRRHELLAKQMQQQHSRYVTKF